jgi:hypothetical protein
MKRMKGLSRRKETQLEQSEAVSLYRTSAPAIYGSMLRRGSLK